METDSRIDDPFDFAFHPSTPSEASFMGPAPQTVGSIADADAACLHACLCAAQSLFWHARPQYAIRLHCPHRWNSRTVFSVAAHAAARGARVGTVHPDDPLPSLSHQPGLEAVLQEHGVPQVGPPEELRLVQVPVHVPPVERLREPLTPSRLRALPPTNRSAARSCSSCCCHRRCYHSSSWAPPWQKQLVRLSCEPL
jgi:hypothetical protein